MLTEDETQLGTRSVTSLPSLTLCQGQESLHQLRFCLVLYVTSFTRLRVPVKYCKGRPTKECGDLNYIGLSTPFSPRIFMTVGIECGPDSSGPYTLDPIVSSPFPTT